MTAAIQGDGSEHPIDWDYRTALPNLEIGDSVSFAVELADLYPGDEGLHSARSQTRRITFLSEEDYLAQIAKQKQRLLTKLRNIYREERGVHELVRNLDRSRYVSWNWRLVLSFQESSVSCHCSLSLVVARLIRPACERKSQICIRGAPVFGVRRIYRTLRCHFTRWTLLWRLRHSGILLQ